MDHYLRFGLDCIRDCLSSHLHLSQLENVSFCFGWLLKINALKHYNVNKCMCLEYFTIVVSNMFHVSKESYFQFYLYLKEVQETFTQSQCEYCSICAMVENALI